MRPFALFSLLAIASFSGGQDPAKAPATQAKEYDLAIKWKPGQKFKFKFQMGYKAETTSKEVLMEAPMMLQVERVEDGIADVIAISGPSKLDGKEFDPKREVKVRMDKYMATIGSASPLTGGGGPSYPSGPVKIGDKWTQEVKGGDAMSSGKQEVLFKAVRTIGKAEVAVLEATISGAGDAEVKGTSTTIINLADGMVDQYTSNVASYVGSRKVNSVKVTLTRLAE